MQLSSLTRPRNGLVARRGFGLGLSTILLFRAGVLPAQVFKEPEGPLAQVEVRGEFDTDVFRKDVKLFSNRDYTLREPPASLQGKLFLRGPMEQTAFR